MRACVCVLIGMGGGRRVEEREVSSPAILGVLIMNGVVCGRCLFLSLFLSSVCRGDMRATSTSPPFKSPFGFVLV